MASDIVTERVQQDMETLEWWYACSHCGAAYRKTSLTFSGGLHCIQCDEVSEMPQRIAHDTQVEALLTRIYEAQTQEREALRQLHRYTITSEGASLGYFRLVEDLAGAWVAWPELEAALAAPRKE